MKTLVYIASTGYSGSTLLESILGSNPRFLNLGEIYKLSYWPVCSCGEKVADCAFWRELERRLQQRPGAASSRLQDWHIQGRRSRASARPCCSRARACSGCRSSASKRASAFS